MEFMLAMIGLIVLARGTAAIPPPLPSECVDCRLAFVICTDALRESECYCNSDEVCCDTCCGGKTCVASSSSVEDDPCARVCTLQYDPVCGSDGVTYGNDCFFNLAKLCDDPGLTIVYDGECDDPCRNRVCTAQFDPVCGSDGETYSNDCIFNLAKLCDDLELEIDHDGPCEDERCRFPRICTLDFSPICGSNGATYSNQCLFDLAQLCDIPDLTIDHLGDCAIPEECLDCRLVDVICAPDVIVSYSCSDCNPDEVCCDDCCHLGGKTCAPRNIDPCEGIYCDIPLCPPGYVVDYDGPGCCPGCKLDCSAVSCLQPLCPPGSKIIIPDGQCCPECSEIDPCENVRCDLQQCLFGEVLDSEGPGCCPVCILDCSTVGCLLPVCPLGYKTVTPDGRCCPECSEIDPCEGIFCDIPQCQPEEVVDYDGPGCCPGCTLDCSAVLCVLPSCPFLSTIITPEGQCCPECSEIEQLPIECTDCRVIRIICTDELRDSTCRCNSNEVCCNDCCGGYSCIRKEHPVDCRLVRCALPECPEGYGVYKPEGACCLRCKEEKEGECPFRQLRLCVLGSSDDVPGCDSDADCKRRQKCCPGVCRNICQDPRIEGPCPDGSDVAACKVAPCDASSCEAYPSAICENNYCGGCFADWFVNGEQVDCDEPTGPCPNGDLVYCFVRPCQFPKCEAYPDATCEDDYCGGCFAHWNVGGVPVDCHAPICELPITPGPCRGSIRKWGFNSKTGECQVFFYGGCQGNANRFDTEESCNEECGLCPDGSRPVNCFASPCEVLTCPAFPDADCVDNFCGGCNADWSINGKPVDCDTPTCELPITPGTCKGYFPSWGFNYKTGQCEEFIYGGCFGNANRFDTEEACSQQCVCRLPLETGPCDNLVPRYGFKRVDCVKFVYGGCEGNANNFRTYYDCADVCKH